MINTRRHTQATPHPEITYCLIDTAWGPFGVVMRDRRLAATFLPQREPDLRRAVRSAFPKALKCDELPAVLRRAIVKYFVGQATTFDVDINYDDLPDFRRRVLEACRRIPFGATASYADLARAVGSPGAARAVGGAMSHNPMPLIVPCHRVLRSDGSLGGFSSPEGTAQKLRMLRLENSSYFSTFKH